MLTLKNRFTLELTAVIALAVIMTCSAFMVVTITVPPASAAAASPATVAASGLYQRQSTSTKSAKIGRMLLRGERVTMTCYVIGEFVRKNRTYSYPMWAQLTSGGYVATIYLRMKKGAFGTLSQCVGVPAVTGGVAANLAPPGTVAGGASAPRS